MKTQSNWLDQVPHPPQFKGFKTLEGQAQIPGSTDILSIYMKMVMIVGHGFDQE